MHLRFPVNILIHHEKRKDGEIINDAVKAGTVKKNNT